MHIKGGGKGAKLMSGWDNGSGWFTKLFTVIVISYLSTSLCWDNVWMLCLDVFVDVVTVLLVCLMPNCVGECVSKCVSKCYLNVFQIKGGDATNENQSRRNL